MGHDPIHRALVLWDASRVIYTTQDGIIEWGTPGENSRRHRQRHSRFPTIVFLDSEDGNPGQRSEDDAVDPGPQGY